MRDPGPSRRVNGKFFVLCLLFALIGIVALAVQAFAMGIVTLVAAAALMAVALRAGDA